MLLVIPLWFTLQQIKILKSLKSLTLMCFKPFYLHFTPFSCPFNFFFPTYSLCFDLYKGFPRPLLSTALSHRQKRREKDVFWCTGDEKGREISRAVTVLERLEMNITCSPKEMLKEWKRDAEKEHKEQYGKRFTKHNKNITVIYTNMIMYMYLLLKNIYISHQLSHLRASSHLCAFLAGWWRAFHLWRGFLGRLHLGLRLALKQLSYEQRQQTGLSEGNASPV